MDTTTDAPTSAAAPEQSGDEQATGLGAAAATNAAIDVAMGADTSSSSDEANPTHNGATAAAASAAGLAPPGTSSHHNNQPGATSNHNNANGGKPVQAYCKLQGENFQYYVQTLAVTLGRRVAGISDDVDVDLGPGRTISRRHARIEYDFPSRQFVLLPLSKNGVHVNGVLYRHGDRVPLETK